MQLIRARFGKKVFEFSNEIPYVSNRKQPLISILIGPNATGKTRCLSNIANAFRKFNSPITGKKLIEDFNLSYSIKKRIINQTNNTSQNVELQSLPSKVICISNSIFDKFPIKTKSDKDFYDYVGIRDSGLDRERYAIFALLDVIQEYTFDDKFLSKTIEVFNFLGLEPKIKIQFKSNRKKESELYKALFENKIDENSIFKTLTETATFNILSKEQQSKIKLDLTNSLYNSGLLEFLKENKDYIINNEILSPLNINLKQTNSLKSFHKFFNYFTLLRKLNILSYHYIEVKKKNSEIEYDLLNSSSGEVNFLTSFVRVIPLLSNNSLILIDEPELSLHPNWQLRYIEKLNELLSGYNDCHVIIATHSPYIVSDADPKNCFVCSVSENQDNSELFHESLFGWSVESILYNVFNVATYRNYYLESDLRNLLELISSKSKNINKINVILNKIKIFSIKDEDPLFLIIKNAEKYLNSL